MVGTADRQLHTFLGGNGQSVAEPSQVADYYDRNTRWFVRVGRAPEVGGIHRELWAPSVRTVAEALTYANVLVHESLPNDARRVLDLGCGVGGSLCWLLEQRSGLHGVGLTLSAAQVELSRQRATRRHLGDRVDFVTGDFTAPPRLGSFDAAFAIESFVHSPSAAAFFGGVAPLIAPGGTLVIIDDFRAPGIGSPGPVARFVGGWHANALCEVDEARVAAARSGLELVADRDLTPLVATGRLRDWAVAAVVRGLAWAPIRHPYWSSLVGGDALQTCLRRGWVQYRRLTFRKQA